MTIAVDRSVLDHLLAGESLGLLGTVQIDDGTFIVLGIDNGNGHTKIALIGPDGKLITLTIPTVYRAAREIRGGAGITSYQVNGGSFFWIGTDALQYEGDALPIGATAERVTDPRHQSFLAACVVEALIHAGYESGIHNVIIGFAIPNDEMVIQEKDNRLGVNKETRAALKTSLFGKNFKVVRVDPHNISSSWSIMFSNIAPQAQSLGTYLIWKNSPLGQPVENGVEALTVIDIGTGDLQRTDVDVNPYRLMGEKIGTGTIRMARRLSQVIANGKLNDAQATSALIHRWVRASGRRVDISKQVESVIAAEGQEIIARILPTLQQNSRFILFTGGGVLLPALRHALEERAKNAGKEAGVDYEIMPESLAMHLNAIGTLVAVIHSRA